MLKPFSLLVLLLSFVHIAAAAPPPVPAPPSLDASSYLLVDYHSGTVLAEHNVDARVEPASITKIMTAYIVFRELKGDRLKLDDEVRISERAWRMGGSRMFVEVGDRVRVDDLLKGMIIQSGNDATVALAEHIGGTEEAFTDMMNAQAKTLGMTGTSYRNSTGWPDPEQYTTARDIIALATALIRDFPEHYKRYSEREFTWNGIRQHNRNQLLWRDASVDGIKTGYTEAAGYCLVTSAEQNGMRLITAVFGTRSEKARADYSLALLNYGFRFFETRRLYGANQPLAQARIFGGVVPETPVGLAQDLYVTIPRGRYESLAASMKLPPRIEAPVARGAVIGQVQVGLDGKAVAQRPLIVLTDVEDGGYFRRAMDTVKGWLE